MSTTIMFVVHVVSAISLNYIIMNSSEKMKVLVQLLLHVIINEYPFHFFFLLYFIHVLYYTVQLNNIIIITYMTS